MKIAFVTRFQVIETRGGTERITKNVSDILYHQYGIECYSLYFHETTNNGSSNYKDRIFIEEAKTDNLNRIESIREYILKWGIDIVVSQNEFEATINIHKLNIPNLKVIFVHHFRPGSEALALKCRGILRRLYHGTWNDRKEAIKKIIMGPYLFHKKLRFPQLYKEILRNTDQLVLLSKGFIKPFFNYASESISTRKISIIPNMLSFDSFSTKDEIIKKQKNKRVLVVSRMDETHKRILKVIKIWNETMKNIEARDWHLDMVGDGEDINYYKSIVRKKKIPNVVFHGSADPIPFYKNASFLLMTSESEGWGLTLTEAQQFGCLPIVFDTYESLHDIITDGENGFIIAKNDLNGFVNKLTSLMKDNSNLSQMRLNTVESTKRFSPKKVGKEWFNMLSSL